MLLWVLVRASRKVKDLKECTTELFTFFLGLICAGVGVLIAETTDAVVFQNSTAFLAILGLVIGIGVAVTPLAVIDSSVATIFVCFAEDPAAFQQSHPELYAPLVQEWHNLYPEIMAHAGYYV